MKKVSFLVLVLIAFLAFTAGNNVSALGEGSISLKGELGKQDSLQQNQGKLSLLDNESKPVIKKDLKGNESQVNKKNLKSLQQSVSTQAENDSPNTAGLIEIGNVYTDYITEEGQAKWFAFQNDSPGKLTVIMQTVQSADVNYDLHLFKLNEETMTLEEETISSYGPQKNEQISKISEGGTYYIAVNSTSGFNADSPFALLVQKSTSYDQSEPDDNIWQAPAFQNNIYTQQTIDNGYDMDWVILQVDEDKTLTVNLNNPGSSDYQLDFFDTSLNPLAGLDDNTNYSINFTAGTYLLRVQSTSTSFDANQPYTLDIKEQAQATDVVITNVDTDDNVEGYLDYGYGDKYRIEHFMNISGQLFDAEGIAVPNANVEVSFTTVLNELVYHKSGTTDSNGNFTIKFPKIQEAVGEYGYNNSVSYHYFDIIPLEVFSNGNRLNSNEDTLYHFAYSVYRPH
ncbi:carboxypeptidase-like regulatory domain-containing protein [Halobacillus salinarum]|uniref:Carboxypeptidase-like regulatory domain-containing protein n=1 Tax=Halobacillus salinarum TaxID=2932257 RepID=A0ABY4EFZ6_9BACI|nr:carboxypeptidase-like regulatory domain-containing protein [Halobacillus salinarum]UOQ43401.1 carboxypeptidase-like regulatory domain-containing protein [Halobacillus salinarum]